jgi:magnesium transporter
MGTDFLAYSLLDALVDSYFIILEKYAEIIATLETEILADGGPRTVAFVQGMKRDMILLRRSVWPLRDVLHLLERGEVAQVKKATRPYFKDVYDHSVSAIDAIENFRDMLSSILDVHLQNLNVKLNDVMKILAVLSAIFLPLNLIASIFGMNFAFIPGAASPAGFLLSVACMAALGLAMVWYFRKRRWL